MKTNHIRTLLSVFLSIVLALSVGLVAFAEQTDSGFQYIADNTKKTAQITGYTGSSIMLSIPDKIGSFEVTSIKSEAFKGNGALISVTIPDTVKTIGSEAFSGCMFLGTLNLGKGVSSIGSKAFENCALTKVSIPAATSSIGAQAFSGCKAISSFSVDDANLVYKSVDGVLFTRLSTSLIAYPAARSGAKYDVPDVTTVESYAFFNAKNLTTISFDKAAGASIGKGAFKNCTSLKEISLPKKLTKIDDELFSGCKKLSSLSIPTTVKSIGANAFTGCTAISALTIPSGVTTVGTEAFSDCTGITSVTIKKNLTAISGSAFSGCTALKEYKVAEDASYSVDNGVLLNKEGTRLIAYPAGSTAAEYTVGDKVTTIGANAFDSCKNLKKLHIPATVKTLVEPAVKNCSNTVIYAEDNSEAAKYFKSHNSGYSAVKIGADLAGDVNSDGVVDDADAILLRRYVAKWENVKINTEVADVNKDSVIDNADVILIRRYVAGWKNVTLK